MSSSVGGQIPLPDRAEELACVPVPEEGEVRLQISRVNQWALSYWVLGAAFVGIGVLDVTLSDWAHLCDVSIGLSTLSHASRPSINYHKLTNNCPLYQESWDCLDICAVAVQLETGAIFFIVFAIAAVVFQGAMVLVGCFLLCGNPKACAQAVSQMGNVVFVLLMRVPSLASVLLWSAGVVAYGYYLGEARRFSAQVQVGVGFVLAVLLAAFNVGVLCFGNFALARLGQGRNIASAQLSVPPDSLLPLQADFPSQVVADQEQNVGRSSPPLQRKWLCLSGTLSLLSGVACTIVLALHTWVTLCGVPTGVQQFYPDSGTNESFSDVISLCERYRAEWGCEDVCSAARHLHIGGKAMLGCGVVSAGAGFVGMFLSYVDYYWTQRASSGCWMWLQRVVEWVARSVALCVPLLWLAGVISYSVFLGKARSASAHVDIKGGFIASVVLEVVLLVAAWMANLALSRYHGNKSSRF